TPPRHPRTLRRPRLDRRPMGRTRPPLTGRRRVGRTTPRKVGETHRRVPPVRCYQTHHHTAGRVPPPPPLWGRGDGRTGLGPRGLHILHHRRSDRVRNVPEGGRDTYPRLVHIPPRHRHPHPPWRKKRVHHRVDLRYQCRGVRVWYLRRRA
ncbi:hypothetical protein HK104_005980, partial [Borealophlyctis nickersoniae]